jgi:hypothetical protein
VLVEVRLPKCRLVLTQGELLDLLARDPATWERALRRGKAVMRQRQFQERGRGERA